MHKFNRLYLLFSLVASMSIPTINLESQINLLQKAEGTVSTNIEYVGNEGIMTTSTSEKYQSIVKALFSLYLIVSIVLISRFLILNCVMINKIVGAKAKSLKDIKLIVVSGEQAPYSYWNYIFVNQKDHGQGIKNEIFEHERAHIKQKHTLDILLIELIIAFFWCNPFLYFYRNAIGLNHEFLADREVLNKANNTAQYAELILEHIVLANNPKMNNPLSSSFNYLKTKKRLIMMTKNYSKPRILIKQILIIPILALAILLFSNNSIAQKTVSTENKTVSKQGTDSDPDLQVAFDQIIKKYIIKTENGNSSLNISFTEEEKKRLHDIYLKMSSKRQEMQIVKFSKRRYEKNTPTISQFEEWKDPEKYGIWIDNIRINNDELRNFSNADFSHYFLSKLEKNAMNYGKHVFQLDLMSNERFEILNNSQDIRIRPNNVNK
ncbi:M56 family metallopeptidase [uncultured Marivirga sp.]|uniref:M56 family metallopeptidase n=1 Tax=uncultured Marivirga sp. TaxID=1123707 RepID=UPI0030ED3267